MAPLSGLAAGGLAPFGTRWRVIVPPPATLFYNFEGLPRLQASSAEWSSSVLGLSSRSFVYRSSWPNRHAILARSAQGGHAHAVPSPALFPSTAPYQWLALGPPRLKSSVHCTRRARLHRYRSADRPPWRSVRSSSLAWDLPARSCRLGQATPDAPFRNIRKGDRLSSTSVAPRASFFFHSWLRLLSSRPRLPMSACPRHPSPAERSSEFRQIGRGTAFGQSRASANDDNAGTVASLHTNHFEARVREGLLRSAC